MSRTIKSRKRRAIRNHHASAHKKAPFELHTLLSKDSIGTYGNEVLAEVEYKPTKISKFLRRRVPCAVDLPELRALTDDRSLLETTDRKRAPNSTGSKIMVLMRGLPSCGKTEAAKKLAAAGGMHLEFDEYFYKEVGDDPASYDWTSDLLPRARQWNLDRILGAIDAGVSSIIVDSDNEPGPFTREYVAHAIDRGYQIRFKEPESSWWHTIRALLKDKRTNARRLHAWAQALAQMSKRTHRVPVQDILHRIDRWEESSKERMMGATARRECASRKGE